MCEHQGFVDVVDSHDVWIKFYPFRVISHTFSMMVRTSLEDRMPHKEFMEYLEYAQRLRYRLYPRIG